MDASEKNRNHRRSENRTIVGRFVNNFLKKNHTSYMDGSFVQPAQAILRGGKLSVLVAVITMFISYTRVLIIQDYFGKKRKSLPPIVEQTRLKLDPM